MSAPLFDPAQRRFAIGNLIAQIGIIVTGGLVRLTGSGLGCSTWPMCEPGAFTPIFHEASSLHSFIEWGNRLLTFVLLIVALGLVWSLARRRATPRPDLLPWALAVIGLIVVQAVIGGISVRMTLHPGVVGVHMAISLGLVALSTLVVYRLHYPHLGRRSQDARRAAVAVGASERAVHVLVAAATTIVAVVGVVVTGTGPHSGDADQPARFLLDPLAVTRTHSIAAWVLLATAVAAFVFARRRARAVAPWAAVLALIAAQGIIGYVQYFTGIPRPLVLAHMLGSALIVVAVAWAIAAAYEPDAPAEKALEPADIPAPGTDRGQRTQRGTRSR